MADSNFFFWVEQPEIRLPSYEDQSNFRACNRKWVVIENKQFCYLLSSRVFVIQIFNISSTFQWNESLIIDRKEMLAVPFRMDFFRDEMKFILTG